MVSLIKFIEKEERMIPNAYLTKADDELRVTVFDSPKFKQQQLIQKLSAVMEERFKKFLLYGALEQKSLVFYFSHNAIASEFMGKLVDFKQKIIPLYKEHKMKEHLYFTDIKAKVIQKHLERKEEPTKEPDRAKGDFEIVANDNAIKEAFERIRQKIRSSSV